MYKVVFMQKHLSFVTIFIYFLTMISSQASSIDDRLFSYLENEHVNLFLDQAKYASQERLKQVIDTVISKFAREKGSDSAALLLDTLRYALINKIKHIKWHLKYKCKFDRKDMLIAAKICAIVVGLSISTYFVFEYEACKSKKAIKKDFEASKAFNDFSSVLWSQGFRVERISSYFFDTIIYRQNCSKTNFSNYFGLDNKVDVAELTDEEFHANIKQYKKLQQVAEKMKVVKAPIYYLTIVSGSLTAFGCILLVSSIYEILKYDQEKNKQYLEMYIELLKYIIELQKVYSFQSE